MLLSMFMMITMLFLSTGCDEKPTSDDTQRKQQEVLLAEGTSQVGMPAIKNFHERKMMKDILELRDQDGIITYTYLENMIPTVVPGHTALGGKYTYLGPTIGYGLPYSTQFTNPQKVEYHSTSGYVTLPQADPNGLFSPSSAEGTWILMADPTKKNKAVPQYIEPRISVFSYQLPLDK